MKLNLKIKLIKECIKLIKQGYPKKERFFIYARKNLITYEQYNNYINKIIMKGDKQ